MKVKIQDLAYEMEVLIEGFIGFLDRRTGKIVTVSTESLQEAEELDEETADLEGLEEHLQEAFDVMANPEWYEELPDRYEIDEYGMMEGFISSLGDERAKDQLAIAIQGKGAFGRFKDAAHRLGVIDEWHRCRSEGYKRKAIRWCDAKGIEYEA